MGALFEHELQLRSSSPQRIVIDYSSPNIAKERPPGETSEMASYINGFLHSKEKSGPTTVNSGAGEVDGRFFDG